MTASNDWYDEARAYDIVYDVDTPREADFLEAVWHLYGGRSRGRVLEPACGSGRLLRAMVRRGHAVTGFDRNEAMLRYARGRLARLGGRHRVEVADLARFDVGVGFDLAFCLLSTFQYLPSEDDARSHLACVAHALKSGGIYVLGLHLADHDDDRVRRERWIAQRGDTRVKCVLQSWPSDPRRRTQPMRSRLTILRPSGARRVESTWSFRTYGPRQLLRTLGAVPDLEHVETFDYGLDVRRPRSLHDGRLDTLVVLRRT
jgi:SAM-dependent methyltransferase